MCTLQKILGHRAESKQTMDVQETGEGGSVGAPDCPFHTLLFLLQFPMARIINCHASLGSPLLPFRDRTLDSLQPSLRYWRYTCVQFLDRGYTKHSADYNSQDALSKKKTDLYIFSHFPFCHMHTGNPQRKWSKAPISLDELDQQGSTARQCLSPGWISEEKTEEYNLLSLGSAADGLCRQNNWI